MTLGTCRQAPANRGEFTLGVLRLAALRVTPTANRDGFTPSDTTPTVCQPSPSTEGVPEARRALSCAPAHPQATPRPSVLQEGLEAIGLHFAESGS